MMYAPEKSDPLIVAAKPVNADAGASAESVEPRKGAKGNTGKIGMHRTPRRASMFAGLERERKRAKQEKNERFTALLHHLNVDLLRAAFFPGTSGMQRPVWMASRGSSTSRTWKNDSWTCTRVFIVVPIGHSLRDGSSSQNGPASTAGSRVAGRQNCPACDGVGFKCGLRRRLPRVLLWVSTRTRTARCARRACIRDYPYEGELCV